MSLFLYSAVAKTLDFGTFSSELAKSPFLNGIAGIMSIVVPISEITVALALLSSNTRLSTLYIYLYMMASFTFYVYLMMEKAYDLPCACLGIFESVLGWQEHLVLNTILTILTFIAILLDNRFPKDQKKDIFLKNKNNPGRLKPSGRPRLEIQGRNNYNTNFKLCLKKFLQLQWQ